MPGDDDRILAVDAAAALSRAAEVVKTGGMLAFPTETVYGLGVQFGDATALRKLRRSKGRTADKPFQILIATLADAALLNAEFDEVARRLATRFWPGPLTLVLPGGDNATVGLRMPDLPRLREIIAACGGPLVATSANRSGGEPIESAAGILREFGAEIDLVLDGGEIHGGLPSTVVRVVRGACEILRPGAIGEEELRTVL